MEATEFGKRIMTLRKQKGMTQAQLAEALGTTVDELLSEEGENVEEEKKEKPRRHFFDSLGKESAYEEVPIDVTALKEIAVEILDALKSGKLFFILYILIMTRILLPPGSTYSDVMNDVECQLARAVVCKYLLILGIAVVVMLWSICKVFLVFLVRTYTVEEVLSISPLVDVVANIVPINMISPYVCKMGVFSSILGLISGLLGGYQKQTKGSIFLRLHVI